MPFAGIRAVGIGWLGARSPDAVCRQLGRGGNLGAGRPVSPCHDGLPWPLPFGILKSWKQQLKNPGGPLI